MVLKKYRQHRLALSSKLVLILVLLIVPGKGQCSQIFTETIGKDLTVVHGAVNGVLLDRNGKRLAVYGDPRPETDAVDVVLFTHHRRDVVWAGRPLVAQGARAVVPAREEALFTQVEAFWSGFQEGRFHDYAQQTSKVLCKKMPVARTVQGGDTFVWQDVSLRVLDTPGYTRGAVTYLYETEGKTLAFTGDLICEDGRLFDLYSLQDAIAEANIRGYHGHAGRLGDLVTSLRKVAAEKPDLLIPVRGPVICDPQAAIDRLIGRVQALYDSLSPSGTAREDVSLSFEHHESFKFCTDLSSDSPSARRLGREQPHAGVCGCALSTGGICRGSVHAGCGECARCVPLDRRSPVWSERPSRMV